jgi:hypothetical protein
MNLKNPHSASGLSLLEVMAALALLSLVVVSLSSLQGTLLRSAVKTFDRVERIIAMKDLLYEAHYEGWDQDNESHEKKEGGFLLRYSQKPVSEASALKKYKDVFIQKVEITWSGLLGEQKDHLITFLYKTPENNEPQKPEKKS